MERRGRTTALADAAGQQHRLHLLTGSAPGSIGIDAGVGGPTFYHKFVAEAQGATPDRRFSYYAGTSAVNENFRYGDQFNGADHPLFFVSRKRADEQRRRHHRRQSRDGPEPRCNLRAWTELRAGQRRGARDRQLHFALPHARDDRSDDVQLLYSVGELFGQYASSVNDLGGAAAIGAPAVPNLDGYKYTADGATGS